MRSAILLAFMFSATPAFPQTSGAPLPADFIHGPPNSTRAYEVPPLTLVSVHYGEDGWGYRVDVAPIKNATDGQMASIPKETFDAIVEEILPQKIYGDSVPGISFQSACAVAQTFRRGNATIDLNEVACPGQPIEIFKVNIYLELRANPLLYGNPGTYEKRQVLPGVMLGMRYGADGVACHTDITPIERPLGWDLRRDTIPRDTVAIILRELLADTAYEDIVGPSGAFCMSLCRESMVLRAADVEIDERRMPNRQFEVEGVSIEYNRPDCYPDPNSFGAHK